MTLHIVPDLVQGTEEWHNARRGMVTASVVGQLLTTAAPDATQVKCPVCRAEIGGPCLSMARKANPTPIKTLHDVRVGVAIANLPEVHEVADNEKSRGLTALLVAERITGYTDPTFTNDDMFRGIINEPLARDKYSEHHTPATEVGFMILEQDGYRLGYSPDGLVGDDGLIEVKSPRAKTHIRTILADQVPSHHMAQIQCGLFVTGRKWLDFISYSGGLPMFVKRVLPDPKWHTAIAAAVAQFETTAAEMVIAYTQAATDMPATERTDLEIAI